MCFVAYQPTKQEEGGMWIPMWNSDGSILSLTHNRYRQKLKRFGRRAQILSWSDSWSSTKYHKSTYALKCIYNQHPL